MAAKDIYPETKIERLFQDEVLMGFLKANHTHLTASQMSAALPISTNAVTRLCAKAGLSVIPTHEEVELSCVADSVGAVPPDSTIHQWSGGVVVRMPANENGITGVTRHVSGVYKNGLAVSKIKDAFTLIPKKSVMAKERKPKIYTNEDDVKAKNNHNFNLPIEPRDPDSFQRNIKMMKASI